MTCRRADTTVGAWVLAALLAVLLGLVAAPRAEALAPLPACGDNIDNELAPDGKIDWPADPGCALPTDTTEFGSNGQDPVTQCSDGLDTGELGRVDFPSDPACSSAADTTETTHQNTQCSNGSNNNDGDTLVDYPNDPGCISASDNSEIDTACSDRRDNDSDGKIDFPRDWGCRVPTVVLNPAGPNQADNDETDPAQCNDGRDNDGDGNVDIEQDADCSSASDNSEAPPAPPPPPPALCADGLDNDGDGAIDLADPGCSAASDGDETDPPAAYVLPQTGNLGAAPATPVAVPVPVPVSIAASSLPRTARLLSPFPIVRLRGSVSGKVVRVSLLSVRAPRGSKVSVYCAGNSCPRRRVAIAASSRAVRVRQFERRLRGGTVLRIYVTKPGFVGKYTRFRFVSNRAPLRADRCATMAGTAPKACPIS